MVFCCTSLFSHFSVIIVKILYNQYAPDIYLICTLFELISACAYALSSSIIFFDNLGPFPGYNAFHFNFGRPVIANTNFGTLVIRHSFTNRRWLPSMKYIAIWFIMVVQMWLYEVQLMCFSLKRYISITIPDLVVFQIYAAINIDQNRYICIEHGSYKKSPVWIKWWWYFLVFCYFVILKHNTKIYFSKRL